MLWGYFDDSGQHDRQTGKPKAITVAGFISPLDRAQTLEREWADVLSRYKVTVFHRAEFESLKQPHGSPYKGWTQEKRDAFLYELLDVTRRNSEAFVGKQNVVIHGSEHPVRDAQVSGIAAAIKSACMNCRLFSAEDSFALVFAEHPEIQPSAIALYHEKLKACFQNWEIVLVNKPKAMAALQAADLVAYEASHWGGSPFPADWSPTLRFLRNGIARWQIQGN